MPRLYPAHAVRLDRSSQGELKVMETEIEVYTQGKRFTARTIEDVDRILKCFKPWK
jgi:hypothetical protein